jgi:hypothetical protein
VNLNMAIVPSLLDFSLHSLLRHLGTFEDCLRYLPPNIKSKLVRKMCKRNLLTDQNCLFVLHDGIMDLDLNDCNITSNCIRHISNICPHLLKLNLSVTSGCRNNINSLDLTNLFLRCARLQVVNLKGCILINDSCINVLTLKSQYLASVSLYGCHLITNKSVIMLSERSHYLQALDLSYTKV